MAHGKSPRAAPPVACLLASWVASQVLAGTNLLTGHCGGRRAGPPRSIGSAPCVRGNLKHDQHKNSRQPDGVAAGRIWPRSRSPCIGEPQRGWIGRGGHSQEHPKGGRLSVPSQRGKGMQHLQRVSTPIQVQNRRGSGRGQRLVQQVQEVLGGVPANERGAAGPVAPFQSPPCPF